MATTETQSPYFPLAPGASRRYGVDWRNRLPDGVTLSSVNGSAPGLTVASPTVSGSVGSVLFSGATAGQLGDQIEATLTGTWSDGQIDPITVYLTIQKTLPGQS